MPESCLNCGEQIKSGLLNSNQLLETAQISVINLANEPPLLSACNKCGAALFAAAKMVLCSELTIIRRSLQALLPRIPIVSIPLPPGWAFEIVTIVTAQTVTGTGIFSDIASAFTDLFGTQSGTYNSKLREGENLCKDSLRGQAIELGANALVGVDIDYAEVGGQRAMIMVCMTGTAVRLKHLEPPDPEFFEATQNGQAMANRARLIRDTLRPFTI